MPLTNKFGFIGGGNMAEALIRGLLAGGVAPAAVVVSEPLAERAEFLRTRYNVRLESDNREVITRSDAVKVVWPNTALRRASR